MAEKFNVYVLGDGGREDAYAYYLLKHPDVTVTLAPGKSGILMPGHLSKEERSRLVLVPQAKTMDLKAQLEIVQGNRFDLGIIGPEDPGIAGFSEELARHVRLFNPPKIGYMLEGNKWWAKSIAQDLGIPTAEAMLVTSMAEADKALVCFQDKGQPVVLKCVGPALGKGVEIIPLNHPEYWEAQREMIAKMLRGERGYQCPGLLVEARYPYTKQEWSAIHWLGANNTLIQMVTCMDHKLLNGLNTGGMAVINPAPHVGREDMEARQSIVLGLAQYLQDFWQTTYVGTLYEGLARTQGIDCLLEINARGGAPETEVQLGAIKGLPLHEVMLALLEGDREKLKAVEIDYNTVQVGIVVAAKGYPLDYSAQKGKAITFPDPPENCTIFPAGLEFRDDKLYTAGGRLALVVFKSTNPDYAQAVKEARDKCYDFMGEIKSEAELDWRTDIGDKIVNP